MYLNKEWRILTIGDGDLSFSWSIFNDIGAKHISASVLDSIPELTAKYQDNQLVNLHANQITVFDQLDILNPSSFSPTLSKSFDLVIFQFPLIPSFSSKAEFDSKGKFDKNTLNRQLIWSFLYQCFDFFLDPNGQQLAYITSKDVKPYAHWNIENLNPFPTKIAFLGWMPFAQAKFPSYQLRNVDRDKVLKSTASKTYVWGKANQDYAELNLKQSPKFLANHCDLCGKGPFTQEIDRQIHQASFAHQRLAKYERLWQNFLDDNHVQ
ncbi:Rossmann-like fold-containing protein [Aliiglaciecola lipolytica]|uniref:25S rRNA (uridine-N(3))-methyltransferase BMT5-like domain-containing protein n=1 Tax=Aliiglaciecola lipolytica E3 TaxID=1127673 RepID=K6YVJ6_9ALTE|nr:Rossmann-like fold-containing protein [Aliiglaciecola lipolytica]GAC15275.1 hypothetical protein GLIP_2650 [Aliiglaciecola lipolytica E3]